MYKKGMVLTCHDGGIVPIGRVVHWNKVVLPNNKGYEVRAYFSQTFFASVSIQGCEACASHDLKNLGVVLDGNDASDWKPSKPCDACRAAAQAVKDGDPHGF